MSLVGKVICFTGALSSMKRKEATQRAIDAGAVVAGSMTKNVNALVVGDHGDSTSKSLSGAGIVHWSEAEFLKALNGTSASPSTPMNKLAPTKLTAKSLPTSSALSVKASAPNPVAHAASPTTVTRPVVVDKLVPNRGRYKVHQDFGIVLNQTNIGQNNNKYNIIQLLLKDDGCFYFWNRWGRVGERGHHAFVKVDDEMLGIKTFENKFSDKTSNKWACRSSFVPKLGKYTVVDLDEEDDGDVGGSLSAGGKAPMGKLTKVQIEKGQAVLEEISIAIANKAAIDALNELSSRFYTLVPTNFGRKAPLPLTAMHQVHEKEELLKFYLRMGFDEVDADDKALPPLAGILSLPIPKTLVEAIGTAAAKHHLTSSILKGSALAKVQAGTPLRTMNKEEYGSIMLYTSNAIYHELNRVLRDENRFGVKIYFNYLRLLFSAAEALPQRSVRLWRGINVDLSKQYKVGATIVWWGINSCTSDLSVAKNFMSGCSGDCTLLTIDTKTAVDISQITFYSNEKESLLMPGTQLRVKSSTKKGKVAEIHLEEIGRLVT